MKCNITLNTPSKPVSKKVKLENNYCWVTMFIIQELVVRVTDEADPFFVYSLVIGEDDFQKYFTLDHFMYH